MAGSSLLALLDDIASILDDVALMTKLAAKKTAGVLGDDLALNAQQVTGVHADRELPVVWAVGKGSLKNKGILVPLALIISAFAPFLVMPLMMVGGVYLCYEGVEKLAHKFLHSKREDKIHHDELLHALADPNIDIVALEKSKIKSAVRTDFILSAEIVTITLGSVSSQPLLQQVAVLVGISLIMTVGVYGLVALIVKLDDVGLHLTQELGKSKIVRVKHIVGNMILATAPYLMKFLSVAGTVAMFLVGGGILVHGLPWAHDATHHFTQMFAGVAVIGSVWQLISPLIFNLVCGIIAGAAALLVQMAVSAIWKKIKK